MQKKFVCFALCVLSAAALAAGCAKARAQTVPDGPALETPDPPSRVFAPLEEPITSTAVAGAQDAPAPASQIPAAQKTTPRRSSSETERAEAVTPPAPAATPTPEPPRELRAASSPADSEAEKKIADLMRRATQALNGVYYQGLSVGRKETYDQAKAFIKEAEQAVKERNFVYAETLADKALKLSNELVGR